MVALYLGIQKPTALGVLPSNQGVIAYCFVGFGVTGSFIAPPTSTNNSKDSLGRDMPAL